MRLLLVAAVCAVYANTLLNGFTIDDPFVYSDNSFVKHLRNLPHLVDTAYFTYSGEASYRPVCTLTYFLDAALWGNWQPGPHLTNLVLYACVVGLVFLVGRRTLKNDTAAGLAALVFALHPVHSEVVDNISFREDLLIGLLLPAAWLLYRRSERGKAWLWLALAWAAYLAATLAKEAAIVFPALAAVLDWMEGGGQGKEGPQGGKRGSAKLRFVFLSGLALVTLVFICIRFKWMQFPGEAGNPRLGGSLLGTLLADVKIQAWYLAQFFAPLRLQAYYPPSFYAPVPDAAFWVSLAALAAVLGLFLRHIRQPVFAGGLLWWFAALAPVANVYPIFNPMAERYLFLPSLGLCLWAGWGLERLLKTRAGAWVRAALGLWILIGCVVIVRRNADWRDNFSIWSAAARHAPDCSTVLMNLASACYERGDLDRAAALAQEALDRAAAEKPESDIGPAYVALASARYLQGRRQEALDCLLQAKARLPMRFDIDMAVYYDLGLIYDDEGKLGEALDCYRRAAELDPFRPDLWRKISFCQLRLGDRAEAAASWARAREYDASLPAFGRIEEAWRKSREAKGEGGVWKAE